MNSDFDTTNSNKLIIFDFDGTLVKVQSPDIFCLWTLIKYSMYIKAIKILFFKSIFYRLLYKLFPYLYSSSKIKILLQLSDLTKNQLKDSAIDFVRILKLFKINKSFNQLYQHLIQGDKVVICSASYDIYLNLYFQDLDVTVLSTQLDYKNNIFTGKYIGEDNIAEEKVLKINSIINLKSFDEIIVYTDSILDKSLLLLGDKRFIINSKNKYYKWMSDLNTEEINVNTNIININKLFIKLKFLILRIIPDIFIVSITKFKYSRTIPNLFKPKSLNDKILWLKLNDRKSWHCNYADKLKVKKIISSITDTKYVIPTIYVFKDINEFITRISSFSTPFIIKLNHDSGGGYIIRDKSDLNIPNIVYILEKRLNYNHYEYSKEFQYKNIKPYIYIEKLLLDKNNRIPNDYKFNMINNKLEFVYCTIDREGKDYRRIYDEKWHSNGMIWAPYGMHNSSKFNGPDIDRPDNFIEMIDIAQKLSIGFPYLRVDFYEINKNIYVGELTQHHRSGYDSIHPYKYDLYYGEIMKHQISSKNPPY